PEIARNRAIYAIETMKLWAEQNRRYAEAREAVEPIREIFPIEYLAARDYFTALEARRLMDNGAPELALELVEEIPKEYRNSDLQEIYRQAYHESTLMRLSESDPLALLDHARWCMQEGMTVEAIRIL